MDLSEVREAYEAAGFDKADLADDPFTQFQRWFGEVEEAGYRAPNAMVLSTVTADGWPSARNVLLKRIDAEGFVFFTNYTSDKAVEMDGSGRAALTFSWTELRRQIRVIGITERRPVERPNHWGGYRVRPHSIEFWQGRPNRLHDRLRYQLEGCSWVVERRAP